MRQLFTRFLVLVFCFGFAPLAMAAARTALVIGNSAYPFGPLLNPANDAKLMSETLKKTGFDVVTVLDADRQTMQKALVDFSREIRTKDTVGLFYFAGHGAQVNGANYLIPVDADIKSESEVKIFAINVDEFVATLERADGRTNIVILDSCRNNPFGAGTRSVNRGMALPDAPAGTFVALSTSPGAVALDGEGNNSPYAEALAKSMLEPDVSIEQAFKVTRRLVLESTKQKQVPWETSSLTGDFYFMPKSSGQPKTSEPEVAAELPVAEPAPEPKTVDEPQVAVADPPPEAEAERGPEVVADPPTDEVNAQNITVAIHDGGKFEQTGETTWTESSADGQATFTFQEVTRNDTTVFLNDPSRNMQVDLDVARKMISFGVNGAEKSDLYKITSMLAVAVTPPAADAPQVASEYRTLDIEPKAYPVGKWPEGLAIANNSIYVAESGDRKLAKLDLASGEVFERMAVGRLPVNVTADPAGNVYTAVITDGLVFKQPAKGKGKAVAKYARPEYVQSLSFGNGAAYTASYAEVDVRQTILTRIDAKTGKITRSEPAGAEPRAFVMAQDAPWLLDASGLVTLYDTENLQPQDSIANDGFLWSMSANLDSVFVGGREEQQGGKSLIHRYAKGNPQDRTIQVLDSEELIVAIAANNDRVAALGVDGTYWILDAISLKPLKVIKSGRRPQAAVFDGGNLYVTTHSWEGENGAVLMYEGVGNLD